MYEEPETDEDQNQTEIVAFTMSDQAFCFEIDHVLEIRGWSETTTLPHAPEYVMGMMNLRGVVLPVVDLSARMGLGTTRPTERHVIIIALIAGKNVGFLVDSVSNILTVNREDLQPTPEVASSQTTSFLRGIYTLDDVILRDIDLQNILLSPDQVAA